MGNTIAHPSPSLLKKINVPLLNKSILKSTLVICFPSSLDYLSFTIEHVTKYIPTHLHTKFASAKHPSLFICIVRSLAASSTNLFGGSGSRKVLHEYK